MVIGDVDRAIRDATAALGGGRSRVEWFLVDRFLPGPRPVGSSLGRVVTEPKGGTGRKAVIFRDE